MVITKNVNNATVYYDDRLSHRWYDAVGENVTKWELRPGEATNSTDALYGWVTTVVEGGAGETTMVPAQTAGAVALITTDAAEYDGINAQVQGEAFKLTAGRPMYFGAKVTLSEATQIDFLVGLCELQTALLATSSAHAIGGTIEGVFFWKNDAVTTIYAKTYKDNAATGSAALATAMDTSAHVYEIYWDGTTAYFYCDGVLVTSVAAGLPDGDLTVSINVRAGSANARTATISWMRCIQVN